MKRKQLIIVVAGIIVLGFVSLGFCRGGNFGGNCPHGNPASIFDGEPFSYEGVVERIGFHGSGVTLVTDDGTVAVYGIGPYWFWEECLGSDYPRAGDTLEVTGYTVSFNGIERNVIVTANGETVRNTETGVPLWRGGRRLGCQ